MSHAVNRPPPNAASSETRSSLPPAFELLPSGTLAGWLIGDAFDDPADGLRSTAGPADALASLATRTFRAKLHRVLVPRLTAPDTQSI
jgi:hypothetical protein